MRTTSARTVRAQMHTHLFNGLLSIDHGQVRIINSNDIRSHAKGIRCWLFIMRVSRHTAYFVMLITYTLYTESQPQLSVERFIGNWWLFCFGTMWTALQLMANTGLTLVKKKLNNSWTSAIRKTRFSQKVSIHHTLRIYCKQWQSPPQKQSNHKLALGWEIRPTQACHTLRLHHSSCTLVSLLANLMQELTVKGCHKHYSMLACLLRIGIC